MSDQEIWLRYQTQAMRQLLVVHPAWPSWSVAFNASEIADKMFEQFHERWANDAEPPPPPADTDTARG